MESALWWGVVLVFLLVVLIASRRPSESDEGDDREAVDPDELAPPFASAPAEHRPENEPMPPPEPGRCPACGTDNDPFYTYCRECVTPLQ